MIDSYLTHFVQRKRLASQELTSYFLLTVLLLGVFTMMTTITGCATNKMDRINVPGNPILNDYGITFEIDWDVFESGTYIYNSQDVIEDLPHQMGGGRSGYMYFYTLILDFKFKDGREFHEEIDLKSLIQQMVKKHNVFDLKTTKWGGFAQVNIWVKSDRLVLDYNLSKVLKKGNPPMLYFKDYYYPVFEKILNQEKQEDNR